jgi:NADH pyrophosphatase NudC (nudix superfamily)
MDKIKDFGLFVTSNASNSHILFGDSNKTPCGLVFEIMDTRYPCGEVRFYLPHDEFKKYVEQNRYFHYYQGYRFCKKCLIAFDKLMRGGNN